MCLDNGFNYEDECPYSADIETLVGTMLRQVEKFVDLDTYTDEKKLRSLQGRSHVRHHHNTNMPMQYTAISKLLK